MGVGIVIGIGVTLLAAVAAYFAAKQKGRDAAAWTILTLLFSPLIIVLLFLPTVGEPTHKRWFAMPLAALSAFSVVAVVGASVWSVLQTGSTSGFPQCGSELAHDTAIKAFAEGPPGKLMGLGIIAFRDDKEISSTDTVKQCTAVVTLNTGADRAADYRIELRGDQYFVFIQLR